VPWFDLRAPSCLPSYAFWFFPSRRPRSDAPSRFWRASRRIAMGRVFYKLWSETRGQSQRRSSGQAFRVEAVRRRPRPNTSAPIGEAVQSWPEPELELRSERWAKGGHGLKRVLRSIEFRLSGWSRRKKRLSSRAKPWCGSRSLRDPRFMNPTVPFLFFVEFQQRCLLGRSYMHEYGIRYRECMYDDKYHMVKCDECILVSIFNCMV